MEIPPPQSAKFFIWQDEQQQGPFDLGTIEGMISEGQITGDTLLCPVDGTLEWTAAKGWCLQNTVPENSTPTNTISTECVVENEFPDSKAEIADDGCWLDVRLDSGAEMEIKAVRLYNEISLARINAKRSDAVTKLNGVSTGLGSIGSIGWVLAASVVVGAVEGVLSSSMAASGVNQLAEVIKMEQNLRTKGVFFRVGKIENIETPIPGLWRFSYTHRAQVEVGITLLGYRKYELRDVQSAFIHSGDDFVTVGTKDGSICSIRWSAVECYAYRK